MNSSGDMGDYGSRCVKDRWQRGIKHAFYYLHRCKALELIYMLQRLNDVLPHTASYVLTKQQYTCTQNNPLGFLFLISIRTPVVFSVYLQRSGKVK